MKDGLGLNWPECAITQACEGMQQATDLGAGASASHCYDIIDAVSGKVASAKDPRGRFTRRQTKSRRACERGGYARVIQPNVDKAATSASKVDVAVVIEVACG